MSNLIVYVAIIFLLFRKWMINVCEKNYTEEKLNEILLIFLLIVGFLYFATFSIVILIW